MVSDIALYKVVEKLQAYSFVDSKADIKGRAFQGVLSSAIRAGMGQYFTPDPIVELAVRIIQSKSSDVILDPFCGSGHFLSKSLDYVQNKYASTVDEYTLHQFKFFHLHGIEKSDRMVRIAMTDMMLHDDGHTNIRNTDSLLSFENYPDILQLEDEDNTNPAVFDIILTNPPFGSLMTQELIGEEAPSRARKVVRAGDIIISTCRPARGAIAIVPKEMDNQIQINFPTKLPLPVITLCMRGYISNEVRGVWKLTDSGWKAEITQEMASDIFKRGIERN